MPHRWIGSTGCSLYLRPRQNLRELCISADIHCRPAANAQIVAFSAISNSIDGLYWVGRRRVLPAQTPLTTLRSQTGRIETVERTRKIEVTP
jgi:uncharacterized membrane protein YfbV (UPF0208 family)